MQMRNMSGVDVRGFGNKLFNYAWRSCYAALTVTVGEQVRSVDDACLSWAPELR